MRAIVVACVAGLAVSSAHAADVYVDPVEIPAAVEMREIVFDLGGGVTLSPKFPSSKIYEPGVLPLFNLRFLRVPIFGEVVSGKTRALSIYPSVDYIAERSESDAAYLDGIPDRDFSLEVGPGIAYRLGPVRAFAEVRYGFLGHEGFVGEFGVDYIAKPIERLEIALGPRLGAATDGYMDTYFGVPSSATELDEYDPSGGITDLGVALSAVYTVNESVRLVGQAGYSHFVGDALDSPIVDAGNDQEFFLGIGLTYRFGFDLYEN